jgi:hypothetical protein
MCPTGCAVRRSVTVSDLPTSSVLRPLDDGHPDPVHRGWPTAPAWLPLARVRSASISGSDAKRWLVDVATTTEAFSAGPASTEPHQVGHSGDASQMSSRGTGRPGLDSTTCERDAALPAWRLRSATAAMSAG